MREWLYIFTKNIFSLRLLVAPIITLVSIDRFFCMEVFTSKEKNPFFIIDTLINNAKVFLHLNIFKSKWIQGDKILVRLTFKINSSPILLKPICTCTRVSTLVTDRQRKSSGNLVKSGVSDHSAELYQHKMIPKLVLFLGLNVEPGTSNRVVKWALDLEYYWMKYLKWKKRLKNRRYKGFRN